MFGQPSRFVTHSVPLETAATSPLSDSSNETAGESSPLRALSASSSTSQIPDMSRDSIYIDKLHTDNDNVSHICIDQSLIEAVTSSNKARSRYLELDRHIKHQKIEAQLSEAAKKFVENFTHIMSSLKLPDTTIDHIYTLLYTPPHLHGYQFYCPRTSKLPAIDDYLSMLIKMLNLDIFDLMHMATYLHRYFNYYICRPSENNILNPFNVHRLVLTASLIAYKYLHDDTYNNSFVASIVGITTKELNNLEIEFLAQINFNLFVEFNAECFEKLYKSLDAETSTVQHNLLAVGQYLNQFMDNALSSSYQFNNSVAPNTQTKKNSLIITIDKHILPTQSESASSTFTKIDSSKWIVTKNRKELLTPITKDETESDSSETSSASSSITRQGLFSNRNSPSFSPHDHQPHPDNDLSPHL